jgi:hypothetical protein
LLLGVVVVFVVVVVVVVALAASVSSGLSASGRLLGLFLSMIKVTKSLVFPFFGPVYFNSRKTDDDYLGP